MGIRSRFAGQTCCVMIFGECEQWKKSEMENSQRLTSVGKKLYIGDFHPGPRGYQLKSHSSCCCSETIIRGGVCIKCT